MEEGYFHTFISAGSPLSSSGPASLHSTVINCHFSGHNYPSETQEPEFPVPFIRRKVKRRKAFTPCDSASLPSGFERAKFLSHKHSAKRGVMLGDVDCRPNPHD